MAEHDVDVEIPAVAVGKMDVQFSVYSDGEKFGRLTVSKGGIGWHPRGPSQERHYTWEQFDRLIQREWS